MRADPDVVSDPANSLETALDHGLGADKDTIAELHGLRMLENDAGADLEVMPDASAKRAHENPADEIIKGSFSLAEPAEQRGQVFWRVRVPERSSELDLPGRVRAHLFASKACGDFPYR
jgi:hypothetical protein